MKVLPPELSPPLQPTAHRHQPEPAEGERGYKSFLSCLRWDFGFTCALCLLHETDFSPKLGAAGSGQMSIEHYMPQSIEPGLRNEYSNCLYACRRCNSARARKPVVDASGRRLLNPAKDTWAKHFILQSCELRPREQDLDAVYTYEAYDLNAPPKVARRRHRKKLWEDRWSLIEEAPDQIDLLLAEAERNRDTKRARKLTEAARSLRQGLRNAQEELGWYPAVPPDAPAHCRCGDENHHTLPAELEIQMVDLP